MKYNAIAYDGVALITIRLPKDTWKYDPSTPIGPAGGFGEVFAGQTRGGSEVAVKRLHLSASTAAHRELKMAELLSSDFTHVMPVLDAGIDADSDTYFIVMPRADHDLRKVVSTIASAPLSDQQVVDIIEQIVLGLDEVPSVVHRDLKPGNILWHENRWKIADFGIARFVAAATSDYTLKESLSAPYAAPEQWMLERATEKSDIYSLGCIAFELISGAPPFHGKTRDEYRHHHLNSNPPELNSGGGSLKSLVRMLLRKNQESRPDRGRIKTMLLNIRKECAIDEPVFKALSAAGETYAKSVAENEAKTAAAIRMQEERRRLSKEGLAILEEQVKRLYSRIESNVPMGKRIHQNASRYMNCGNGTMEVEFYPADGFSYGSRVASTGWDVLAFALARVHQVKPDYVWGACLIYMRLSEGSDPRWYEIAFYDNAYAGTRHQNEPFGLAPREASDRYRSYGVAYGPQPIDDEHEGDFWHRWVWLLTEAMNGRLRRPSHFPIENSYWSG